MLVGLLNLIFTIADWILIIAGWALVIYFILRLVIPQNKYILLFGRYVEVLLTPIRGLMQRFLPKLNNIGLDWSPLVLWLLLTVARWLLSLLRVILL